MTGAFSRAFNDELHEVSDDERFRRAGLTEDEIAFLRGESNSSVLPSLPQGFVDFAAGIGDGLLLGFGDELRGARNIDGGVNRDSGAYFAGEVTSFAAGGARIAYAGAVKIGARLAPSGAAASAFRNRLKVAFRFGLFRNFRTGNYLYSSDAALRAGAGRTNIFFDAYGAGIVGGGVFGD